MSLNYRFELPNFDDDEEDMACPYNEYCGGEFDCGDECQHQNGDENMNEYVKKSILLNTAIENEFAPLEWVDITVHEENGTGSISFTGPHINVEKGETCMSASFRGREDGFFAKMHRIKNMIKNCGYTADLIKFEANHDCLYSEATININFEGGEL